MQCWQSVILNSSVHTLVLYLKIIFLCQCSSTFFHYQHPSYAVSDILFLYLFLIKFYHHRYIIHVLYAFFINVGFFYHPRTNFHPLVGGESAPAQNVALDILHNAIFLLKVSHLQNENEKTWEITDECQTTEQQIKNRRKKN